ncbi:MAG: TolC family protein, partial [Leptospirales bacterium]
MGSHFFRATAACFALSLYFIFGAARLLANDPAAALDPSTVGSLCSAASNSAVLRCVLDHHPDLRVARAELKRLEAELGRASQRVNPSVESRVLGGDSSFSAEASIRHTIETGGKRGARMDVAEQNISVARSRLLLQKNRLVAESALRILRLRQVLDDTALLEETRGTYLRAIRRMRSRPALSSEQRVNLATYEIAADEARSRQTVLASEAIQLRTELAIATGLGGDALASVLGLEL